VLGKDGEHGRCGCSGEKGEVETKDQREDICTLGGPQLVQTHLSNH
jgi:hypothetical protein